jgi:diketogulonate reductase-like aldo/keto reductase
MEYIKLYNGVQMPTLGYGVFLVSPEECERCVSDALSVGYLEKPRAFNPRGQSGVDP